MSASDGRPLLRLSLQCLTQRQIMAERAGMAEAKLPKHRKPAPAQAFGHFDPNYKVSLWEALRAQLWEGFAETASCNSAANGSLV